MQLLLSNDDGIDAPGLQALEERMRTLGTVWTVAPDKERSAQSHALTLTEPLRAIPLGERRWAVSGTPADCVYLAVHHLLERHPAVVVSGINDGSNLGNDVHYSGTVAAAREACLHGLTAVSISLHRRGGERPLWDTACAVAERVVQQLADCPLPRWVHLNVNVPNIPLEELKGLRACVLGRRTYAPLVDLRRDPRGRQYFWIGGGHDRFEPDELSDGRAVEEGWASVTPIHAYPNHLESLVAIREWTDD